ncbi:MAG: MFS transporter [Pseudomonadota bacterium]|jgi:Arabinose efflux permease|nr:MAG: hypothetical protein DIU56_12075 [Pseudomonadota bacterium]
MKLGSWPSIVGIVLFGILGASTVSKLIPLGDGLAGTLGLSPAEFGWLISLIAVPAAILALPSGVVVDRFGPRAVLITAAAVGFTANVIYWFAPSVLFFQIARLLEGAAIVHFYTAGPALLMANPNERRRGASMTLWATYPPVGTAVGLALGGFFAEGGDWRQLFVAHGALYLVIGLVGLLQPRIERPESSRSASVRQRVLDLRNAYSRPPLLLLAFANFLVIGLGVGANVVFPEYFARLHELPIVTVSGMLALATLAMVVGSLCAGVALSRGFRTNVLFAAVATLGIVAGFFSFYPELPYAAHSLAVGVWFFTSGAAMALLMASLPVVAEPQRRGAAAALCNQTGALAVFVNPPLWLSVAAGGGWVPLVALQAAGWSVAVAAIWPVIAMSQRDAPGSAAAKSA